MKLSAIAVLVCLFMVFSVGEAARHHQHNRYWRSAPAPEVQPEPSPSPDQQPVFITGYGVPDNDCDGGSGDCTYYDGIEDHAGGDGTFDNPITLAVGASAGFAYHERIYLPYLRVYTWVEDTCVSCDAGRHGLLWIDVFHGPDPEPADLIDACASYHTGTYPVIIDPEPGLPVVSGGLLNDGYCQPI
jgi:hypothetical protein